MKSGGGVFGANTAATAVRIHAMPTRQRNEAAKRRPDPGMRAQPVIPGDAAGPGMADRGDQHERSNETRGFERHRESGDRAERMTDHDGLSDAKLFHCLPQRVGLAHGR